MQRQVGGGTYAAERRIGYEAPRAAGVPASETRALIEWADGYLGSIGVGPTTLLACREIALTRET